MGATAVIIGAFGAHGLKPHLSEYGLGIYETGVSYHFYHTCAIGLCAVFYSLYKNDWFKRAIVCFVIGVVLFSGSLYLLAIKEIMNLQIGAFLGPLTPIGGIFFIAGWSMIVIGGVTSGRSGRSQ